MDEEVTGWAGRTVGGGGEAVREGGREGERIPLGVNPPIVMSGGRTAPPLPKGAAAFVYRPRERPTYVL